MAKIETINYQGKDYATVPGFEDYAVSQDGDIISRLQIGGKGLPTESWHTLKPYPESNGYMRVKFYNKTRFGVHQVVAKTWIENRDKKAYVNHINGIKTDNNIANLEWVTAKENAQHALLTGLKTHRKQNEDAFSRPVIGTAEHAQVRFASMTDAERHGYKKGCISLVCAGKRKYHRGMTWEYAL